MNNPSDPKTDSGSAILQDVLQNLGGGRYQQAFKLLTKFIETEAEIDALAVIYPTLTPLFQESTAEDQRTHFLTTLLEYPFTTRALVNFALITEREAFAEGLTKALRAQAPDDPDVLITQSLVFKETNRLDEALEAANLAVQFRPQELTSYFWRANLYRFLAAQDQDTEISRAYNHALQDYEQVLKLNPGHLEGHGQRGTLYLEWGDYLAGQDRADEARPHYQKALQDFDAVNEIAPEMPEGYLLRGRTWTRLDQPEKALADFDKALEIMPDWLEALNARGLLHEGRGAYDRALEDYEGLVRAAPESPVAYRLRADAHLGLDHLDDALADYKQAIELDPAFIEAYLGLAHVQAIQENYDLAMGAYDKILTLDPGNLEGLGQRGTLYLEWGDHLAGQDDAEAARPRYEKARQDFDAIIKLEPGLPLAYLQRGRTWNRLEDAENALADYDRALDFEPNWVEALNERGLLYEAIGAYDQALADYERLAQVAPESPVVYRLRADAQLALGNFEAALADYQRALEIDPAFIEAYLGLARVQAFQEEYDLALQAYEQALKVDPGNLEGLGQRGTLFLEWGDHLSVQDQADEARQQYQKALQDFDDVIGKEAELALAYLQRGRTWNRLEEAEKAVADYDKALEIEPNWVEALNERGLLHEALGAYDRALEDYERLAEEAPESPVVYRLRADALLALGKYEAALADYQRVLEIDPAFIEAYLGLAQVQAIQENYDLALGAFDKILTLDPGNLEGHGQRGSLFLDWGDHLAGEDQVEEARQRYQKALQDFEAIIRQVPELPLAYLQRGRTWNRLEEAENALADYDKALEIEPNWVEALNERGLLLEAQGMYDRALADYERLAQEAPESPVVYRLRADVLLALGKYQAALADYNRALEIDPKFTQAYLGRADVHEKLGNDRLALQDYEYSILLAPDEPLGYFLRGLLYNALGDGYQAIWDIDRALALDDSLPQGYTGRAAAYLKVGEDYQSRRLYGKAREACLQALQDSKEALKQDPADYYAHRSSGLALWNLEDYEAAARSFDQAIEGQNPAAADLLPELYTYKAETLGLVAQIREQPEIQQQALQSFDHALARSADPGELSWINYSKGKTLLSLKRAEEALPCFERAREINPEYPWAYYGQGRAQYLTGQFPSATESFEALQKLPAVRESGLAPYAEIGLGLIRERTGDQVAAGARYAAALPNEPIPADFLDRARIFNEFDAEAHAEADYQKALALAQQAYARAGEGEKEKALLAEQLAEAYNALAWFYVDEGRVAALKETFIDYASQAVRFAAEAFHKGNNLDTLGWGYYQIGEYENAYEHLQEATALTPHDFMIRFHFEKAKEARGL